MIVFKNAKVYAPEYLGKKDILIEGNKIVKIEDDISCFDNIDYITKYDIEGKIVVPGFIDLHEHIIGGGCEGGPTRMCPCAKVEDLISCGITTVVGMLGTDGITHSLKTLLAKCKSFNDLGITCYMLTGSYAYPTTTILNDVEEDIVLIEEIIGTKVAMSDHRSDNVNEKELLDVATRTHRGGLLADKVGFVTIHTGSGKERLKPLFKALKISDLPANKFLPTHMNRNRDFINDGIELIKMGGYMDFTAGETTEKNLKLVNDIKYVQAQIGLERLSVSSDAYGSIPKFNEEKELVGLAYSKPESLFELFQM